MLFCVPFSKKDLKRPFLNCWECLLETIFKSLPRISLHFYCHFLNSKLFIDPLDPSKKMMWEPLRWTHEKVKLWPWQFVQQTEFIIGRKLNSSESMEITIVCVLSFFGKLNTIIHIRIGCVSKKNKTIRGLVSECCGNKGLDGYVVKSLCSQNYILCQFD